jgi:hypothetical protein
LASFPSRSADVANPLCMGHMFRSRSARHARRQGLARTVMTQRVGVLANTLVQEITVN